jgi:type IV pilus assembly protein PilB
VEAILAQRLVRRICTKCREETEPPLDMLADLGISPDQVGDRKFYKGKGCDRCNNTGYKGRVGLFELMIMNDELRDLVMQNVTIDEMRKVAAKCGMIPLRDYGLKYVFEGVTTAEEVVRETVVDG